MPPDPWPVFAAVMASRREHLPSVGFTLSFVVVTEMVDCGPFSALPCTARPMIAAWIITPSAKSTRLLCSRRGWPEGVSCNAGAVKWRMCWPFYRRRRTVTSAKRPQIAKSTTYVKGILWRLRWPQ